MTKHRETWWTLFVIFTQSYIYESNIQMCKAWLVYIFSRYTCKPWLLKRLICDCIAVTIIDEKHHNLTCNFASDIAGTSDKLATVCTNNITFALHPLHTYPWHKLSNNINLVNLSSWVFIVFDLSIHLFFYFFFEKWVSCSQKLSECSFFNTFCMTFCTKWPRF